MRCLGLLVPTDSRYGLLPCALSRAERHLLPSGRSLTCFRVGSGWFAAAVAPLVCIDIADLQQFAAVGLTDVPVAAMVAVTVFLLWRPQTRATAIVLVLASALTAVSKSTGLIALGGLGDAPTQVVNG